MLNVSLPTLPLQEVSCSLNFDTHTGRGKVSLANPRYSGLRGDSLSGGFRWERDVVRLEKLVVQQQRSRYVVAEWQPWDALLTKLPSSYVIMFVMILRL